MSRPSTSDNSSAVGLFPFLAVLLCTMGALLVLLVVLAQRIGTDAILVEESQQDASSALVESSVDPQQAEQLSSELELIRSYQEKLDELKREGRERLAQDKARLSHSEDHIRRLEHELAQLSLAAEQMKASEEEQNIDKQQAKKELARLERLIEDTEKQLDELRETVEHKRSYALVPFKGKNGTYARPINIVCDRHGVTLQPEGTRFVPSDFVDANWPGNPLAAALRASREYIIQQEKLAGNPTPLDPYPLFIVKPDGINPYHIARKAVRAWDSSYGYEFINADWKLKYSDLPDPQLAKTQQHAVLVARDRLTRRAKAAPSRFRGVGTIAGGGRGVGGGNSLVGTPSNGKKSSPGSFGTWKRARLCSQQSRK